MDVDTSMELRLEDTKDAPPPEADVSDDEDRDGFDTENVPNRGELVDCRGDALTNA